MIARLIDVLFGCSHENLSLPFGPREAMYRCCLDCGKRFPFEWDKAA